MGSVPPPASRKINTGLIVAVVGVLALLFVGGGAVAWLLVKDDGSSSASGGSTSDPKEEAAKDMQYAFSLVAPSKVSKLCDAMFAYGNEMAYPAQSECVADTHLDQLAESELAKIRDVTVSPSHFQETGDDTLSIRMYEIYPAGSEIAESYETDSTYTVWVMKDVAGNGDWRVVGITDGGRNVGTIPDDAEVYAQKGD